MRQTDLLSVAIPNDVISDTQWDLIGAHLEAARFAINKHGNAVAAQSLWPARPSHQIGDYVQYYREDDCQHYMGFVTRSYTNIGDAVTFEPDTGWLVRVANAVGAVISFRIKDENIINFSR